MDIEDEIEKELRSGRKSDSELRRLIVSKGGFTVSTYQRHLRRLVKTGKINYSEAFYELPYQIVDKKEIQEIIAGVDGALERQDSIKERLWIIELRHFCQKYRLGNVEGVLDALSKYSHNTTILEDGETLEHISSVIFYILENEKKYGNAQSLKNVIEKLSDAARNIVSFALHSNTSWGANCALSFLGEAEDKESADLLMHVVEGSTEEWYRRFRETLQYVLFESKLAKRQRKYIIEKIADPNLNEEFRLRLKELQRSSRVRYAV